MPRLSPAATGMSLVAALAMVACGQIPAQKSSVVLAPATAANLKACAPLGNQFKFDNTVIDSAAPVAAGTLKIGASDVAEHCLVKGAMHQRTGSDAKPYAIGFEMRLPNAWNGRFYYQGNGGLDGAVRPALGDNGGGPITHALMQGFAVISSDAGHTGAQTPFFGLEPQSRLDYGYQAVGKLAPMAKALIASAYGKAPDRSYIGGCSNGGRHTMVAAARYGEQFDGYLAGAPGYRLPNAALAQIWGAQLWNTLATPGATVKHPMNPAANITDLGSGFTPQERQTVADAILAKCDAMDGVKDGLVQATQACQTAFNMQSDVATCSAQRTGSCLSVAQKNVLASIMAGGKTSTGQNIYSSFSYDPGIAGSDWATWKFVNSLALDPLAIGTVFRSPPKMEAPLSINVNEMLTAFNATDGTYKESGLSLMSPPGNERPVNLESLKNRGAKMLVYHGVSDPIFSAEDTRQWVERVNTAQGGKGAEFLRYYPVPGMNHCRGGLSTDQFDLLTPLVNWVERGIAPGAVVATARGAGNAGGVNTELPKDWSATRSRPLCAYPSVATYKGSGSVEDAANFSCR